jgi:hypothetical protein
MAALVVDWAWSCALVNAGIVGAAGVVFLGEGFGVDCFAQAA